MKVDKVYSDTELITAISNKDALDDAIRYIYQQYADTVSSFILNNSGSQQDAEDIFQETVVSFIEMVQKNRFRGESSVKTFLVSIARNCWLNELKKKERSGFREKAFENSKDEKEIDISHLISDREIKQQFQAILDMLGDPCKKILLLFYFENLSMKEMLQHLPYENEQVVRNKKYKCLQQLTSLFRENPDLARRVSSGI